MTFRNACSMLFSTAATISLSPTIVSAAEEAPRLIIEEITVTARRRSENIQDTPIAITAFTGDDLTARQATSLDAVANFTPALTINSSAAFSGSSQTVAVFMRGIGQTDFSLNTDPGVGIYVDDVYISRSVGALLDLVDVEQLAVLHGPQGTLFGRNSVGGAISITTARPADESGGRVFATLGSDNWYLLGSSVDIPLGNTVNSKLTVQHQQRDGYVARPEDGLDLGDKDNLSARAALTWTPAAALDVFLSADYTRSRENGVPLVLDGVNPGAAFAAVHNLLVAPQLNPALQAFANGCLDPAGAIVGGDACYDQRWVSDGGNTSFGSYPVYSDIDVWGVSATVGYELNEHYRLKSITAYRDLNSEFARDGDGSPLQINSTEDMFDYRQWSQELQLLGELLDGRLSFIVGGFAFDEKGVNENIVDFGFVRFLSGGAIHNSSLAAFGQASYRLTDATAFTVGIRYTDEKKRFTPDQVVLSANPVPFFPPPLQFTPGQRLTTTARQVATATELTPHLNLSLQASDHLMLYTSYSRGFKSGGFTQRIFPALETPPAFEPETVDVVEAGFKFSNRDRTLRLNAAAYYSWYSDLQVTVPVGVAPTTQNAAEARIKGMELEGTAVLLDALTATLALGYTDAGYRKLDARVSPTITVDNALPGTPEWTVSGSLAWELAITDQLTLTPRMDWSYRSEYFFDAENLVGQGSYQLVNASVTLARQATDWSATLFGKNLTDEAYNIHGEQILDPVGFRLVSPARGVEWGIRLEKGF